MRFYYAVLFFLLLNGTMNYVGSWNMFGTQTPTVYGMSGWNYQGMAAQYGCSINTVTTVAQNVSNVNPCKAPSYDPTLGGIFNFGDWVTAATNFIVAFSIGLAFPFYFLVNTYHFPVQLAIIINAGLYLVYAGFWSFFIGNRDPTATN